MFETWWQLFTTLRQYLGYDSIILLWETLKQNKVTDEQIWTMIDNSINKDHSENTYRWKQFIRSIDGI